MEHEFKALVLKIHADDVFISLGGPDEGVVPFVQFKEEHDWIICRGNRQRFES